MRVVFLLLMIALLVGVPETSALAQATVTCDGTESGGDGIVANCPTPHRYAYEVTHSGADKFYFCVEDGNLANYTNICMPPDWTVYMISATVQHRPYKTAHGTTGGVVNGLGQYALRFDYTGGGNDYTSPIGFAFDHPSSSHDAGWYVYSNAGFQGGGVAASAVGMGEGFIHTPSEEPPVEPVPSLSRLGMIALVFIFTALCLPMLLRRRKTAQTKHWAF